MTGRQSNKWSMLLKVNSFFNNNSSVFAPLAHFTPFINEIATLIEDITHEEASGNQNMSGYTEQKSTTRIEVETVSHTVGVALLSWGSLNAQPYIIEREYYLPGSLGNCTDSDLYVLARQLFAKADPVKNALVPFGSGPADVGLLDSRSQEFLPQIRVARNNRKMRSRSVKQVEQLFKRADEVLETLDIFLKVYQSTNPILHSKYSTARKIDKVVGGHTVHKKRGNVLPAYVAHAPFAPAVLKATARLLLTNQSRKGDVVFYFSREPRVLPLAGDKLTVVAFGKPVNITASDAGYTVHSPHLNIRNPNVKHGSWKAEVVKNKRVKKAAKKGS